MSLHNHLGSDAYGYIDRQLCREPLYPLFLAFFKIFGSWQLVMARISQTIITFLSLLYAAAWLQKKIQLKKFLVFLVLLFMATLISLHCKTLTKIFSEGLAFPLFVVLFLKYVEAFEQFSIKNVLLISIGTMLLILTRMQFLYLYAFLCILLIWHLRHNQPIGNIFRAMGIIILTISTGLVFSAFYYKHIAIFPSDYKSQRTGAEWEFTGWRFTVQPLFLAEKDKSLFKIPTEEKLYSGIYSYLYDRGLTRAAMPQQISDNKLDSEFYYMAVLGKIQDNIRAAIKQLQPGSGMSGDQVDHFMKKMTLTIFLHHAKDNMSFYFLRLGYYFANPFVLFSCCILLFAVLYRFITDGQWKPSITHLFVMIGLSFVITNAGLLSVVEVTSPRYFYYQYFLYFCFAAILANKVMGDSPLPVIN